jgi:hypothetical protein
MTPTNGTARGSARPTLRSGIGNACGKRSKVLIG